jgi:hypothetical protein
MPRTGFGDDPCQRLPVHVLLAYEGPPDALRTCFHAVWDISNGILCSHGVRVYGPDAPSDCGHFTGDTPLELAFCLPAGASGAMAVPCHRVDNYFVAGQVSPTTLFVTTDTTRPVVCDIPALEMTRDLDTGQASVRIVQDMGRLLDTLQLLTGKKGYQDMCMEVMQTLRGAPAGNTAPLRVLPADATSCSATADAYDTLVTKRWPFIAGDLRVRLVRTVHLQAEEGTHGRVWPVNTFMHVRFITVLTPGRFTLHATDAQNTAVKSGVFQGGPGAVPVDICDALPAVRNWSWNDQRRPCPPQCGLLGAPGRLHLQFEGSTDVSPPPPCVMVVLAGTAILTLSTWPNAGIAAYFEGDNTSSVFAPVSDLELLAIDATTSAAVLSPSIAQVGDV